ncbi:hypothetical protein DUNSADRAFT_10466 [Dunaliella salina]|uniref:Uncharacterized protein n=1 Tax=Dunaliella salina TaxID=3046 RepID=A0ABQ7GF82_DUNSA|nr:hypothetical protein DUNSADRAFT_10466 [Dunaliella salina]|eukprot:KAF5833266.1 hypothetical protein DUNSADRAFT_10466 [Dunaliella salina]
MTMDLNKNIALSRPGRWMSSCATPTPGDVGVLSFTHTQIWAAQEIIASTVLFFSKQEFVKHHLPIFVVLAMFIIAAAALRRARPLKAAVILASLLRILMTLQNAFRNETPSLILYADLPAHLLTFLPEMLILDWRPSVPLFMLVFCHAGACTLFYNMTRIHGIVVSFCRAFGIHAVCLFVFLAIRHKAHSYGKRAPGAPAGAPPKAIELLQSDAEDMQQHKLRQKHQHERQRQEQQSVRNPAKAQQPEEQQEETAGRPAVEQSSDAAAAVAGVPPLSMSKLHKPPEGTKEGMGHTAAPASGVSLAAAKNVHVTKPLQSGPAETRAALGSAPAVVKRCGPVGESQPQPQRQGRRQSAIAQQPFPERQGDSAPWSSGDSSSISSVNKSSIVSSSVDSTPNSTRFLNLHQGVTHHRSHSLAPATPLVPKAVADVLKAKAELSRRAPYVSKMSPPHSSGPDVTMHYLQTACRLAVKINGPCPDNVPRGSITNFQDRLQRYQRLMPAESPAVRAGCLVISYGAMLCSHGHTLQQMRDELLAVASEWAHEHGLLPSGGEKLLTVQACCQSSWASPSTNLGLGCPPEHSIIVHQPFLESIPCSLDQEVSCTADLTLIAPPHHELRGWHGAADAPEDLPDGVKSRSLCLLASLDGQHLPISVERCSHNSNGEWSAQVQVSLPEAMRDAAINLHPKVLVLELWAAGKLTCSYATLVLPTLYSGALTELLGWAGQAGQKKEESAVFVRDLVVFMHFQATCSSAAEEGQHGPTDVSPGGSAGQADKEVLQMAQVGMDLLGYSLGQDMNTLAGMLMNALALFPTACSDLLGALTPTAEQVDGNSHVHQQHSCQHHLPSADAGHSFSPAEHPKATQQLQHACHERSFPSAPALQQPLFSHSPAHITPIAPTTYSQPGTPCSARGGGGAAAAAPDAAPEALPTAGASSAVSSPPPPSMPSSNASTPPTAAAAASRTLKDVVTWLSPATTPAEEEGYQAWKHLQIAPLSRSWCLIQVLCMGVGVLRSVCKSERGWALVSAELGYLIPLVPTFAMAALFTGKAGPHTELILVTTLAARACFCVLLGLGVVPVPVLLLTLLNVRAEVLAEIFMNSVAEQVRMRWMLPLRLLLTIAFGLWYRRTGVVAPWCEAIAVNASALAVSKVIDTRYRHLYALSHSNAKQGKADASHQRRDEAPGCGQGKVGLPNAGLSTALKCKQV